MQDEGIENKHVNSFDQITHLYLVHLIVQNKSQVLSFKER